MRKITREIIEEYIVENNIELSGTHKQLCIPIIERIYNKMLLGIKFNAIGVDAGWICDGHHRYIASLLAGFILEVRPYIKTSATEKVEWDSVAFVEEDWDTPAKIKLLNKQDAEYNGIALSTLLKRLNNI